MKGVTIVAEVEVYPRTFGKFLDAGEVRKVIPPGLPGETQSLMFIP